MTCAPSGVESSTSTDPERAPMPMGWLSAQWGTVAPPTCTRGALP